MNRYLIFLISCFISVCFNVGYASPFDDLYLSCIKDIKKIIPEAMVKKEKGELVSFYKQFPDSHCLFLNQGEYSKEFDKQIIYYIPINQTKGYIDLFNQYWHKAVDHIREQDYEDVKGSHEIILRAKIDQYISFLEQNYILSDEKKEMYILKNPIINAYSFISAIIRMENISYLLSMKKNDNDFFTDIIKSNNRELMFKFWLLVQHADVVPNFQKYILSLMEGQAYDGKLIDFIIRLKDRFQLAEDNTQIYGTHFLCENGEISINSPLKYSLNKTELLRLKIGAVSFSYLVKNMQNACAIDYKNKNE